MPFLSGLELLQRLQNEYPEIITIAISGYDDFDKVKGVFVSGGLDYLLKPVGKEEMVKVLTKALGLLEERENAKRQDETSRIQKHKLSSFLEDSEYSALLSGNCTAVSIPDPCVQHKYIFRSSHTDGEIL